MVTSPYDSRPHPVTAQEAKGHGLKAHPQYDIQGGDGIVYYPSTTAETPSSYNDRNVRYALIDIFATGGLWAQRANTSLFANLGTFAGDTSGDCGSGTWACTTNSANAPWGWDDGDDLPGRGQLATDPAKLSVEYFTIAGGVLADLHLQPVPDRGGRAEGGRADRTGGPRLSSSGIHSRR